MWTWDGGDGGGLSAQAGCGGVTAVQMVGWMICTARRGGGQTREVKKGSRLVACSGNWLSSFLFPFSFSTPVFVLVLVGLLHMTGTRKE